MKKIGTVAVVSRIKKTALTISQQLTELLGNFIEFKAYSVQGWLQKDEKADFIIVSTHILIPEVAQKTKQDTKMIILRRSLLKKSWLQIVEIAPWEKIMLVNDDRDSTFETISLLYELGARHLELIPVYPGLKNVPPLKTAISPGETHLIPPSVENIIDIGDRIVDLSTLVDLLNNFDIFNNETMAILAEYAEKIIPRNQGLQASMLGLMNLKNLFQQSLDIVEDGIITYDENNHIIICNQAAENIFNCHALEVTGHNINHFLNEKNIKLPQEEQTKDLLLKINQQNIVLNKHYIYNSEKQIGGVITLQIADRLQESEKKLRSKLKAKGHQAKYSFQDLIYESNQMKNTIETAKKLADNSYNILILGETGTGKEILAHAIHQASPRKNYPFVAINCSALPDSLLESELFGYEEGAFTGARKGGKPGLFEQAHRGTIFLDEIGGISANLQARLLRVVQQKEVLKIGATSVLPVDTRIIAATNRDLNEMVKNNDFRADLFHRLNVLGLKLPPLRTRKKDIIPLIKFFLTRQNYTGTVDPTVYDIFQNYHWPGNVRELENTIDYLIVMSFNHIHPQHIPFNYTNPFNDQSETTKPLTSSPLIPFEYFEGSIDQLLLELIFSLQQQSKSAGRRSLAKSAREKGLVISERQIQLQLHELSKKKLITIGRGRKGCTLTPQGIAKLQELQKGINGYNGINAN